MKNQQAKTGNDTGIKNHTASKKTEKQQIQDHVEAFLKAGGKISQIPSGTSGQPSMACRRFMTISENAPDKEEEKKQAKTA